MIFSYKNIVPWNKLNTVYKCANTGIGMTFIWLHNACCWGSRIVFWVAFTQWTSFLWSCGEPQLSCEIIHFFYKGEKRPFQITTQVFVCIVLKMLVRYHSEPHQIQFSCHGHELSLIAMGADVKLLPLNKDQDHNVSWLICSWFLESKKVVWKLRASYGYQELPWESR